MRVLANTTNFSPNSHFRYHFLPIDMSYHRNWNFCYHIGSLASTQRLDVLLHCEVLSLAFLLLIVIVSSIYLSWLISFLIVDFSIGQSQTIRTSFEASSLHMRSTIALDFVASGRYCWKYHRRSCIWLSFSNLCYF